MSGMDSFKPSSFMADTEEKNLQLRERNIELERQVMEMEDTINAKVEQQFSLFIILLVKREKSSVG